MNTIRAISTALCCIIAVLHFVSTDLIEPESLVQGKPQETFESEGNQERAKRYEEYKPTFLTGDASHTITVANGGPMATFTITGPTATTTVQTASGDPIMDFTVVAAAGFLKYAVGTDAISFANNDESVTLRVTLTASSVTAAYSVPVLRVEGAHKSVQAFRQLTTTATPLAGTFNQGTLTFDLSGDSPKAVFTATGLASFTYIVTCPLPCRDCGLASLGSVSLPKWDLGLP